MHATPPARSRERLAGLGRAGHQSDASRSATLDALIMQNKRSKTTPQVNEFWILHLRFRMARRKTFLLRHRPIDVCCAALLLWGPVPATVLAPCTHAPPTLLAFSVHVIQACVVQYTIGIRCHCIGWDDRHSPGTALIIGAKHKAPMRQGSGRFAGRQLIKAQLSSDRPQQKSRAAFCRCDTSSPRRSLDPDGTNDWRHRHCHLKDVAPMMDPLSLFFRGCLARGSDRSRPRRRRQ